MSIESIVSARNAKINEIASNDDLSYPQKRVAAGKATREAALALKETGLSNAAIADLLQIAESSVRTINEAGPPKGGIEEIVDFVKAYNHSVSDEFVIEGPWGFRGLAGLETDVYIFQKGTGAKLKIGKAVAKIEKGLKFEVELDEEYKDYDNWMSFEVPMRFSAKRKK